MNPVAFYRAAGALIAAVAAVAVIAWVSGAIYGAPRSEQETASQDLATRLGAPESEAEFAERIAAADAQGAGSLRIRCVPCHTFGEGGPHGVGPNLWGVLGRSIAGVEGYAYSESLSGLGGVWSFANLDAFLADPAGFVPETRMTYAGAADPARRADLLLYLRGLSGEPAPLPAAP